MSNADDLFSGNPLPQGSEFEEPTEASQPVLENIYDAFAHFLRVEVANGDATEDTVQAYYREVSNWVNWCRRRHIAPEDAQDYHIEAFREEMKRRGMCIATRAHKLSIIRRFYEGAIYAGLRSDNPADGVWAGKDLTSPEDKLKVLSESALTTLVNSLPVEGLSGWRDRVVVALMAAHGLRRVEIHRLNHDHIRGDLASSKPGTLLVDGKGHKVRVVHLRSDTWTALITYVREKEKAGYQTNEGAVFVGHGNNGRGGRLSRVSINSIVDKYLNASSLKRAGVSCHALRHTFGTLAVAGGAKVEHLRDAMGHAKLETTGVYVKAVEKAKNNPAFFINVEF
ncbi:tyrosine recombinase XerD [Abditibacteriota bacterium]|nr:tyrosine recombinase XerD [Abditibacteriota bacterium]